MYSKESEKEITLELIKIIIKYASTFLALILNEKKRSIDFLEHNSGKILEWSDQRIVVDRTSYSPELKKNISRIFTLNRYTGKLEHKLLGSVLNYNCSKANKKF